MCIKPVYYSCYDPPPPPSPFPSPSSLTIKRTFVKLALPNRTYSLESSWSNSVAPQSAFALINPIMSPSDVELNKTRGDTPPHHLSSDVSLKHYQRKPVAGHVLGQSAASGAPSPGAFLPPSLLGGVGVFLIRRPLP